MEVWDNILQLPHKYFKMAAVSEKYKLDPLEK